MVVFLWQLLSICLLKVFLDVPGNIAWFWKWANFLGRSFFIIVEEQANFFGFFIIAKEQGDFFGWSFFITSMLLLSFIFWLSRLIFLICVWLTIAWESLSTYTCLWVFSHLATFRWLTSSYEALSFRFRQWFTLV